jgi:hypothetical protein
MTLLKYSLMLTVISFNIWGQAMLKGIVAEKSPEGKVILLQGANIMWEGTELGTTSDENGLFSLPYSNLSNKLIISFVGYEKLTLNIISKEVSQLEVFLKSNAQELGSVEVTGTKSAISLDYFGIENKSTITEKELLKAACCNLSESFETNPSIDVSFSDAITGAKQIEMLGLSGIYTQTTMENLPFLRGLYSMQGLSFIPGTWMQSINVSKGIGSVANGFESITGQIDIEMQKPISIDEKPFYLNIYSDNDRRYEGNLNYRFDLSNHLSFITMLHGSSRNHFGDANNDGFSDMPTFNTLNIMQRWFLFNEEGLEGRFGFQFYKDKKQGGTLTRDDSHFNNYNYNNQNQLFNVYMKTGYVFQESSYKSFGLQLDFSEFKTNSIFGMTTYTGNQKSLYANLIYQSVFIEEILRFRLGTSFVYDLFEETLSHINYERTEKVPGTFFELTYKPDEVFSAVAGFRIDYHNYYGTFFTPRLHLRYAFSDDLVFRIAAGKGFRTSNIFTEYASNLVSARKVNIIQSNNFGYGLEQEAAWNLGFNATYYFIYNYSDATFSVDFYRTQFSSVTIADLDSDPQVLSFYSVKNGIYSNSLQTELNFEPINGLQTRIAYRLLDVIQNNGITSLEKPLTSKHRALLNLSYSASIEDFVFSKFDYNFTLQWFSKKRIPNTQSNPDQYKQRIYSPDFALVNTQITGTFSSQFEIYLGIENLLNFRQDNPIVSADNVQSKYFDASLIWAPLNGRMVYTGLRFKM